MNIPNTTGQQTVDPQVPALTGTADAPDAGRVQGKAAALLITTLVLAVLA